MSLLRNRLARNLGLVVGLGAGIAGISVRSAKADVIVPTVAATAGQHGSNWQSDLRIHNPYNQAISFSLIFTERGQSMSASDPAVGYILGPNMTVVFPDAYHVGFPGRSGVARVLVKMDYDASNNKPYPDPVVDPAVFNDAGDGAEFGQSPAVYTAAQLEAATGTSRLIVGKEGERTNPGFTTGGQGATATITAYGPAGGNAIATKTITLPPDGYFQWSGTPDGVAALLGAAVPANSTLDVAITQGSGVPSATIVNNITNDSRWKDFQPYTQTMSLDDQAILYVNKWLPRSDSGFYLSNREIRAMINGGQGTRSYAHDIAEILFNHSTPQPPFDVAFLEQALRTDVDGNIANGELYAGFDPINWTAGFGVRFYETPTGQNVTDFHLDEQGRQLFYQLVKGFSNSGDYFDGFLWRYVRNNPDLYGGQIGGAPSISYNPTWNSQDPN